MSTGTGSMSYDDELADRVRKTANKWAAAADALDPKPRNFYQIEVIPAAGSMIDNVLDDMQVLADKYDVEVFGTFNETKYTTSPSYRK